MTTFRVRFFQWLSLLLLLLAPADPLLAQNAGRDASFLPVPADNAPAPAQKKNPAGKPLAAATPPAAPAAVAVPPAVAPVESGMLKDINPESIGLLSPGLGADMWKGTPRALADRLLPSLSLPSHSPTPNDLAQRFLLTTAGAPEGPSASSQSLTAMRVEKLVALGDAADAWKFAMLAKPEQMDEITLRLAAEAALVSDAGADVCAKLPDIMKQHASAEWQKSLLVCQLRANDTKAAQLSLDVLHTQNVKDDAFFALAEKNIIGGGKQLPRQLTPLRPLSLALLRIVDLPVRDEVYARPDAALVPELLKTKALSEPARLALAERTAAQGLLSAADLANIYQSEVFAPEMLVNPVASAETGPKLRALLYQAAQQEKTPQKRITLALQFLHNIDAGSSGGAVAQLLAEMAGDIPATAESNASSASVAHILVLGGKSEAALAWLKLAHNAATGMPGLRVELQNFWPLTVFAGLEADENYAGDLSTWLDGMFKPSDIQADIHAQQTTAASVMLLLDADGFIVPDALWAKVAGTPEFEKRVVPPAFFFERLRASGDANRRAEAVLESLIATGGGEPNILATIEAVRALRLVGLTAEAANLAREAAAGLLAPVPVKPQ